MYSGITLRASRYYALKCDNMCLAIHTPRTLCIEESLVLTKCVVMVVIGTGYWQTSFVLPRVEFEVAPHLNADALNGGCCDRVGIVHGCSRRLTGLVR